MADMRTPIDNPTALELSGTYSIPINWKALRKPHTHNAEPSLPDEHPVKASAPTGVVLADDLVTSRPRRVIDSRS